MRSRRELAALLRPREKHVQGAAYALVRGVGGKVWNLTQARATKQSAGLPDAFLGYHGKLAVYECKRPGGKLTGAQQDFRAWCESAGWTHLSGGVEVVRDWLVAVSRSVD